MFCHPLTLLNQPKMMTYKRKCSMFDEWTANMISSISEKLSKCTYRDTAHRALMTDLCFGFCYSHLRFLI